MVTSKMTAKKIALSLIVLFILIIIPKPAFALNCDLTSSNLDGVAVPMPSQIICPLLRLLNLALMLSGVVLAVLIGYGAIKLSVSLGDPKGYEGSMRTFLFAIIGFFVVVGSFSLLLILNRTLGLGLEYENANHITDKISEWWEAFLRGFLDLSEETSI